MIQEILQKIVDQSTGAQAAILMGFDGIAVMQATAPDATADIESVAMEFSFRFIELRKAAQALDMGEVHDITIKADQGTLLVRVLSDEYFVCSLLRDAGHMGRCRWVLRSNSPALSAEL